MNDLRERRLALNWTQDMLSSKSGIDQTTISTIETGRRSGRDSAAKLERVLARAEAAQQKSSATQG
jgi:transcriptional regulator with XRE-family HTH domain